jgi:hypothetical protein
MCKFSDYGYFNFEKKIVDLHLCNNCYEHYKQHLANNEICYKCGNIGQFTISCCSNDNNYCDNYCNKDRIIYRILKKKNLIYYSVCNKCYDIDNDNPILLFFDENNNIAIV